MKNQAKKSVLFVFSLMLIVFFDFTVAKSQETLTNSSVIKLSKVGLSDAAIIGKINNSNNKFNTDVDSMIYLKEHGVSSAVIKVMDSISSQNAMNDFQMSHANDPTVMHPSGIYYYDNNPANPQVIKIEPNTVAGASGSGYRVYGFSGSSLVYTLNGEEARLQINNSDPTFYFYFNPHDASDKSFDFALFTSPNAFTLVTLSIKNNTRYFGAGSSSGIGLSRNASNGINPDNICDFNFTKISDGIYEVRLKTPQRLGEFAFIATGRDMSHRILFDWGIDLH